jgi:hypothetical protein
MRLSTDPNDPAYTQGLCGGIKVFFNGIERCNVRTADEEKRLVVVLVVDEHGCFQVDREKEDVLTEALYGDVRIEITDSTRKTLQLLGAI